MPSDLLERTQSLEDTARRLADFAENLRDLQHSLTRCEDKLASHDALGGAAKDPKLLDRIKVRLHESFRFQAFCCLRVHILCACSLPKIMLFLLGYLLNLAF